MTRERIGDDQLEEEREDAPASRRPDARVGAGVHQFDADRVAPHAHESSHPMA